MVSTDARRIFEEKTSILGSIGGRAFLGPNEPEGGIGVVGQPASTLNQRAVLEWRAVSFKPGRQANG